MSRASVKAGASALGRQEMVLLTGGNCPILSLFPGVGLSSNPVSGYSGPSTEGDNGDHGHLVTLSLPVLSKLQLSHGV